MLLVDWRDDPRLPRSLDESGRPKYYSRRAQAITAALIHNTGGNTDILADNRYHRLEAIWDAHDRGVRAPHIAYHYWVPFDPDDFLTRHNISREIKVKSVVVWCNHLWERSWHGNLANDAAVGIAAQLNGEVRPLSDAQKRGIMWILNGHLPSQGVKIPRWRVWGHGETPAVHGGGPEWGNRTVCPGKYVLKWVRALRADV